MTSAVGPVQPIQELLPAIQIFRLFEIESAPIGSGRPAGAGNERWGAVVIVARAALESALRRLHGDACPLHGCEVGRPPLDPVKFTMFMKDHGWMPASEAAPLNLHVALRSKPAARSGAGTGQPVGGPRTFDELVALLGALNHIRNGFAHRDRTKIERLPGSGSGVLWVKSHDAATWSVQKPHAFSAVRYCESFYRLFVLWLHGHDAATACRSPLMHYLRNDLEATSTDQVMTTIEAIRSGVGQGDLSQAFAAATSLRKQLLAHHSGIVDDSQERIPGLEEFGELGVLYDPLQ